VASIYGPGVIKALDLALASRRMVPLNAWWLLDCPEVQLLSLADVQAGMTIGGRVTLLILTPRPQRGGRVTSTPILGETAQASVTRYSGNDVRTINIRAGR
jgi:hypothetical protein